MHGQGKELHGHVASYTISSDNALHEKKVWYANGRRDYQWKI